jgi:SAM-dependent methyltransferase
VGYRARGRPIHVYGDAGIFGLQRILDGLRGAHQRRQAEGGAMTSSAWSAGGPYDRYVGRWSRLVAAEFVDWLAIPPGRRWLDVGCGTGALTAAVLAVNEPAAVVGVDPSEGFLTVARSHVVDARAGFEVGDARSLPVPDDSADVVVSGLALNFVPDAAAALREFTRVCAPGGVIAAYVWDYAEGMAMMRYFWDAAVALDPAASSLDEGPRFPLCRPDALRERWIQSGLTGVEVRAIDVPTVFEDFDDYWSPFLGGQGPAPQYVAGLRADARDALRERLRSVLGTGRIALTARAWAVVGGC